jgi:iron complex transport system permease protein
MVRRLKPPYFFKLAGLFVLLFIAMVFSVGLGRYSISFRELAGIIFFPLTGGEVFWSDQQETVFMNVRLPRILLACFVGCCLSAAGAAYQGVFQNPMASPDILGASNGAAFGAALAILFSVGARLTIFYAFACSLVSVALVLFVSSRARGRKVLSLILSGIMVSSLFSAATSFIKLAADPNDQLPAITYWLMGSMAKARMQSLIFALPPMIVGLVFLLLLRWRINLLTLSDDEAKTMGVNVFRVRILVILAATLITAASVSVSGLIGWVGLVIPHLARRFTGSDYRQLLPASMLCGAIFMLLVDNVSRNLLPTEIPIGILTAFIGAPFFMWLITREEEVV